MKFFEWNFDEMYVMRWACIWFLPNLDDYNDKVAELGIQDGDDVWSRNLIQQDELVETIRMFMTFLELQEQSKGQEVPPFLWRERLFFIVVRALCYFVNQVDNFNNEMTLHAGPNEGFKEGFKEADKINVNEVTGVIAKMRNGHNQFRSAFLDYDILK